MEAFESFVALAMESEDLVVSEAVKFDVKRKTRKASHVETQTHGFEVDLVGARSDLLVLATVKSFFGSRGVVAGHVTDENGTSAASRGYALLNNAVVRNAVVAGAAERYGYGRDQIELRLYVGKFAGSGSRSHEPAIRAWAKSKRVGRGPIQVIDLASVAHAARRVAEKKQYRDNAALVAIKVLGAAGMLTPLA